MKNKKEIEIEKAHEKWEKAWEKLSVIMRELMIDQERCKMAIDEVKKANEELEQKRKIR